jgi:hypothetical protein
MKYKWQDFSKLNENKKKDFAFKCFCVAIEHIKNLEPSKISPNEHRGFFFTSALRAGGRRRLRRPRSHIRSNDQKSMIGVRFIGAARSHKF